MEYKFEVGQFTTFQCDPGYTLKGREQILCRADAEWNDVPPTCNRKYIIKINIRLFICLQYPVGQYINAVVSDWPVSANLQ